MHRRSFLLGIGLVAASLLANAQTKRPIRETDLYDFHWIADARILPLTGNEVHDSFIELTTATREHHLKHLKSITNERYRLDLFEKI